MCVHALGMHKSAHRTNPLDVGAHALNASCEYVCRSVTWEFKGPLRKAGLAALKAAAGM